MAPYRTTRITYARVPQGREACTQFWSKWVEPNAARLTAAPLVSGGGKYTLIRLCKKLAQRMSKTHDSSFCGQVRGEGAMRVPNCNTTLQ